MDSLSVGIFCCAKVFHKRVLSSPIILKGKERVLCEWNQTNKKISLPVFQYVILVKGVKNGEEKCLF